jgi:hypothetical protein
MPCHKKMNINSIYDPIQGNCTILVHRLSDFRGDLFFLLLTCPAIKGDYPSAWEKTDQ